MKRIIAFKIWFTIIISGVAVGIFSVLVNFSKNTRPEWLKEMHPRTHLMTEKSAVFLVCFVGICAFLILYIWTIWKKKE